MQFFIMTKKGYDKCFIRWYMYTCINLRYSEMEMEYGSYTIHVHCDPNISVGEGIIFPQNWLIYPMKDKLTSYLISTKLHVVLVFEFNEDADSKALVLNLALVRSS